jgi:hypothetical protein
MSTAVGSVQRGVELGYRVIDEYIKQGAAFAAPFTPSSQKGASGQPPSVTPERMLQYASDLTSMWFDAMGTLIANGSPKANGAGAVAHERPQPSAPSARAAGPVRIQIALRAKQDVDVLVTLEDTFNPTARISLESLRSPLGKDALSDVDIVPAEGGGIRVTLNVPEGTARTRYSGAIIDGETNNPQGRVTIQVVS